jgi:sugar/nucleoside kinase (ribokinase family)
MIDLTKRKIGKDKILLVNGTRATNYREILDWEGVDGVMIEHFAAFNSEQPAAIRADLETIALAAAKGKFVVLKGWPGFNWIDTEMMKRPNDELLKLALLALLTPQAERKKVKTEEYVRSL